MKTAILAALLLASPALAQTLPAYDGKTGVIDAADIIPDEDEAAINQKLVDLGNRTKHAVVVMTAKSLDGYPIEDYANTAFRSYKIGSTERNDGVLLLLAPNEPKGHRGPKIEVGYGLEPELTDADSSLIVQEMNPLLKAGDITGAVETGIDGIATEITKEAVTPQQLATRQERVTQSDGISGWVIFAILAGIAAVMGIIFYIMNRSSRASLPSALDYTPPSYTPPSPTRRTQRSSASSYVPGSSYVPYVPTTPSPTSKPSSYSPPPSPSPSYSDDTYKSSSYGGDYGSSSSSSSSTDWSFSDGGSSGGGGATGSDW